MTTANTFLKVAEQANVLGEPRPRVILNENVMMIVMTIGQNCSSCTRRAPRSQLERQTRASEDPGPVNYSEADLYYVDVLRTCLEAFKLKDGLQYRAARKPPLPDEHR